MARQKVAKAGNYELKLGDGNQLIRNGVDGLLRQKEQMREVRETFDFMVD